MGVSNIDYDRVTHSVHTMVVADSLEPIIVLTARYVTDSGRQVEAVVTLPYNAGVKVWGEAYKKVRKALENKVIAI